MTDKPLIVVKPCPFCGGRGRTHIRSYLHPNATDVSMDEVMVYCINCNAQVTDVDQLGVDHLDRARDVLKRWNRRAKPTGFKP